MWMRLTGQKSISSPLWSKLSSHQFQRPSKYVSLSALTFCNEDCQCMPLYVNLDNGPKEAHFYIFHSNSFQSNVMTDICPKSLQCSATIIRWQHHRHHRHHQHHQHHWAIVFFHPVALPLLDGCTPTSSVPEILVFMVIRLRVRNIIGWSGWWLQMMLIRRRIMLVIITLSDDFD